MNYPIRAIICDTETTGLTAPQPIEVAIIHCQDIHTYDDLLDLKQYEKFNKRYKPTKAIEAGAQKVHGISMQDVEGCPRYLSHQLPISDTVEYIIGHNISYDMRALRCEAGGGGKEFLGDLRQICTLKLARKLWPEYKEDGGYSLANIIQKNYPTVAESIPKIAHGALADCFLTLHLLDMMCAEYELDSWEELYNLQ